MQRRRVIQGIVGGALVVPMVRLLTGCKDMGSMQAADKNSQAVDFKSITKTEAEWRAELTAKEFHILREAGTELPGSSKLLVVKKEGTYVCAGCGLALFKSEWKYHSGTGWPSFWNYIDGRLGFKTDWALIIPRKEYYCARCGGHQGHVFEDGPEPTGLRYCNNGLALDFVPVA